MNTPNKLSKQIDLRDVRGASIRPSRAIPSKMDKMKDPKRQRRERIDYEESDDDEDNWYSIDDNENVCWKIVDDITKLMEDKDEVKSAYIVEEFPPTLEVIFNNGSKIDIAVQEEMD